MATIEKLQIQGIRSFGSETEDSQSIIFSAPLTLILGKNGCGKTTIIECLKYALTGEVPPGSDRGKSFVHDPKIFRNTETLGQIKLQVCNLQGERASICRSMRVSIRRGKYAFETLDATMNYLNGAEHNTDSITNRCVDVDGAMSDFMGVSKSIINNVLFCHQEDSSWPMDEPKKLKEKFDAIFGVADYNRAIDEFVKLRKKQQEELKLNEANLQLYVHLKQEVENKNVSLQQEQEKHEDLQKQCTELDVSMKPIDDRLAAIQKIEYDVGKYQAVKVELQTKQKNCQEQISNLHTKIVRKFVGSIAKLDEEIENFDRKMAGRKIERDRLEQKLNLFKQQEKALQLTHNDLDKKRCDINRQLTKEQECISKRAEKMKSLCVQLNIYTEEDLEQVPERVPDILDNIQNAILSEQCQITEKITQFDNDDQERQREIDSLLVQITKSEENVMSMQRQKTNHEKEAKTVAEKIAEIEVSAYQLNLVGQQLKDMTERYDSISSKQNLDEMRQFITSDKAKIAELQTEFRTVDERLTVLNSLSKLMAEIALKEKELEKREQEIRRVKSKHSDNFKNVFAKPTEGNYRRALQTAYENLRRKIKELNEKANEHQLKVQSYEIKRKNLKDELERSKKELEDLNEKIFEKCHSTPFEELLLKSQRTVTKYQLELGAQKSAEAMYKKYITKIGEDPCCPLCHKGMSANEVVDLKTELSDEIHHLPQTIKNTERILKAEQTKFETLLQLRPVIEKVARLEGEIPKRKEELKKIQETLNQCVSENEALQMLQAEPTHNLELANSMMGDMSLLDEAIKEGGRLKCEIEVLKRKLPKDFKNDESVEALQMQKNHISKELESKRLQVESMQENMDTFTESLNQLREKKNNLKDQQLKLQEGLQSLPQIKERAADLEQLLATVNAEIEDSKGKLSPLKKSLSTANSEKARLKEANRKKLAQMQKRFETAKNLECEINRLHNEVLDSKKLNLNEEILRLKEAIKTNKADSAEKTKDITECGVSFDKLKTECITEESVKRNLKDNRELKILEEKQAELNEQNKELLEQLGNLDFFTAAKEKKTLIKQREKATVKKGELLGMMGEINNQIHKLQKQLNEPQYKDAINKYRKAFNDAQITRRMIADLGNYRVALEWSIMQFHTKKMEKINALIREYWRLIYRGNDIDYVQIQTDTGNTGASADTRRNYNYRVVQSKNDSEIDMRGRCSAGQRVLASLIIRLALAETFSSNCGVIALDEPTTNLDDLNILSLCDALNRIVEERKTQSNFMLIIITHDEKFISTLGKIQSYHSVSRNDEGKSVIRKTKVF